MPQIDARHSFEISPQDKIALAEAIFNSTASSGVLNLNKKSIGGINFFPTEFSGREYKMMVFVVGLHQKPERSNKDIQDWMSAIHQKMSEVFQKRFQFVIDLEITPLLANPAHCVRRNVEPK